MFEWCAKLLGNLGTARTMAIQALVMGNFLPVESGPVVAFFDC